MADAAPTEAAPAVIPTTAPPATPPSGEAAKPPETPPAPPDSRMLELEAQTKRLAQERMKFAAERRRENEERAKANAEIAKAKAEAEAYRKEREDRFRNPAKYLKADYGEDWYDKLSKVQLDGVPPAGLIASEVDEKFGALKKELEDYKAQVAKERETERAQTAQREKEAYEAQAISYIRGAAEKFPLVHAFGLTDNITAVIQAHFDSTTRENEAGELVPGEVLTFEEAAKRMEAHLTEKLAAAEKLRAPKAPPPQSAGNGKPPEAPRRTLSTQLTGSSPPTPPVRVETEAERRRRALAAGEAAAAASIRGRG